MKYMRIFTLFLFILLMGAVWVNSLLWMDLESQKASFIALQERVMGLEQQVQILAGKKPEIIKQIVKEPAPEDLLIAAVAKVAPAVVSIVISKDVPKLEVVYENPFGNDPFFKDFGFKIPRYRQKGTVLKQVGAGTGFLISKNGYLVTNRHVVGDQSATYTVLLSDGSQKSARVIYRDEKMDIALAKIEGDNFTFVTFGDSSTLKLGTSVFAIGNALGEYSNSVSRGIISGLNRTIEASGSFGVERLEGILQTDAAINPGNSGGPLVDFQGKVVGVNVATVRGSENISFAIPVNIVKGIINKIIRL